MWCGTISFSSATISQNVRSDCYRIDLRDPQTVPLNFTKSINLALSERGMNAIGQSGPSALLEKICSDTIPMVGRMIHGESSTGELYEKSQNYDIHNRVSITNPHRQQSSRAESHRRLYTLSTEEVSTKLCLTS